MKAVKEMIQIDKPMPEGCNVCPLMYDYIQCNALPEGCKDDDAMKRVGFDWTKRPEWCPLKEREAVEPILICEAWNKYYNYYECPRCKNEVIYDQKYCSECGISFLWEGQ